MLQQTHEQYAVDPQLAVRVAHGTATSEDLRQHRAQVAEQNAAEKERRAERTRGYAEQSEKDRQRKYKDLNSEFEQISDEMRALSPNAPLWHELREQKKELAKEVEDIKAADELATYNKVREDRKKRSESQRQFNVAQNAPFTGGPAPIIADGTAADLPGVAEPPEGEQDPSLDSRDILKGSGAARIALASHDKGNTVSAHEAVNRE